MSVAAGPGIRIRPFTPADRDACIAIFRSNLPRYFDRSEQAEFEGFLEEFRQDYYVVEMDGTVVACGGCYIREGIGRLCWGMVSQGHHRTSIGTHLLVWRINHLFERAGLSEVRIDTSQHTEGFFARHGFRTTLRIPNGFGNGIDLVAMSLLRDDWMARVSRGPLGRPLH